jgi:hypothetical protein
MKDEWFDDYYSEIDEMFESIQRGLNGLGLKSNQPIRDTSSSKPIAGFWDDCECCTDHSEWEDSVAGSKQEFEEDLRKTMTGEFTKEDYFRFDLYNIQDELADVLLTKHEDYGKSNIADAPGGALNGIRVRMYDKIARLNNLIDNNKEPKHESIRDTLVDIANYATIALMVIDGTWDK